MEQFKHYIITRFNVGFYNPDARPSAIYQPLDEWMKHRIRIFTAFTLPSIMYQTCQNFTWLVLMDKRTPQPFKDIMDRIPYQNLQLVYMDGDGLDNNCIAQAVLENIEQGDYDLVTTRIDNDDAFHLNVVETIQQWYAPQPESWAMIFPNGLIIDLAAKKLHMMSYWFNNCPTLIERSQNAKTVHFKQHSDMSVKGKMFITDKLYWLQVIHSRNIDNTLLPKNSSKVVYKDSEVDLAALREFGIDVDSIVKMQA